MYQSCDTEHAVASAKLELIFSVSGMEQGDGRTIVGNVVALLEPT